MASKRKNKDLGPVHTATIRCVADHSRFAPRTVLVFRSPSGEEERSYPSAPIFTALRGHVENHTYREGDSVHRSLLRMLDEGPWELLEVDGVRREPDALPE